MGRKESGMRRSTAKRRLKRGIAYLLTLALVFSLFSGTGFTSMASEAGVMSEQNESGSSQTVTDDSGSNPAKGSTEAGAEPEEEVSGTDESGEEGLGEAEPVTEEAAEDEAESGTEDETDSAGAASEAESGTETELETVTEETVETETETETETVTETETENAEEKGAALSSVSRTITYTGETNSAGTVLTVTQSEMEADGQAFDREGIEALLAAGGYQKGQFRQINIIADNSSDTVFGAGIFNAMRPYINLDSGYATFSYQFNVDDYAVRWMVYNPGADLAADVPVSVSAEVSGGTIQLQISGAAGLSGCAAGGYAQIIMGSSSSVRGSFEGLLKGSSAVFDLYEDGTDSPLYKERAQLYTISEKDQLLLQVNDAQGLSDGSYQLKKYVYRGDVTEEDGRTSLVIDQNRLEYYGGSYTAEGITEFLSASYEEGTFDRIWMEAWVNDKSISPQIYNAFLPYLNPDNSGRELVFSFYDGPTGDEYLIVQSFTGPHTCTDKAAISTDATLAVENGVISFSLPHASDLAGWADRSAMQFMLEEGTTWRDNVLAILGDSYTDISVYDADGTGVVQDHGGRLNNDGNGKYWIDIDNIQELAANTTYTIRGYGEAYKGTITGSEEYGYSLDIDQRAMERCGLVFDAEGVAKLLADNYEGQKFVGGISLEVRAEEGYTIRHGIFNAVLPYVDTSRGAGIGWNFLEDNVYSHYTVQFFSPYKELDADVAVDMEFAVTQDSRVTVTLAATKVFQGMANNVAVTLDMDEGTEWQQKLSPVLGDSDLSLEWSTPGYTTTSTGGWRVGDSENMYSLSVWNAENLEAGLTYTAREAGATEKEYVGSVNTMGHYGLTLDEYSARKATGNDGLTFTDEYLLNLLEKYYSGEEFDDIHIRYANDTVAEEIQVSAELWNGLRSYLTPDPDSWPQFEIGRGSSESSYDFNYWFIVPEKVTEAVTLYMPVVEMANRTVSFPKTQYAVGRMAGLAFPCDEIVALYDDMTRINLKDGSGETVETANIREGRVCDLFIQDLDENTPYSFAAEYVGSTFENSEYSVLTLNENSARKAKEDNTFKFTDEYLLNLLSANYTNYDQTKRTFDIINIQYAPDSAPDGLEVSATLWNGVLDYRKSAASAVEYAVADGTGEVTNFAFDGLEKMTSESVLLDAKLDVDHKTVSFAQTQFPAEHLTVVLRSAGLVGMFDGRCDVELLDGTETVAAGFYAVDAEAGAGELTLGDVQNLMADTVYTFKAAENAYTGTVSTGSNGRKTLVLVESEAKKNGVTAFTGEYVLGLLQTHYSETKFEDIRILYDAADESGALAVSQDYWNGLLAYLEQDGDTRLVFHARNAAGQFEFWIRNPEAAESDRKLELALDAANKTITVGQVQLPAEKLERIAVWPDDENIRAWYEDSREIYLMSGNLTAATGYFIVAPDGSVMININNVQELEYGKAYTINDQGYIGSVNEQNEGKTLHISRELLEKSGKSFDQESVEALLANYDQKSFYRIEVFQDASEANVLESGIFNAMLPYLDPDLTERQIWYIFDSSEYSSGWHFINPGTMTENRTMNVSVSAADGELRASFVTAASLAASAQNVQLNYWVNKGDGNGLYEVLEALGTRDLSIHETDTGNAAENEARIYGSSDIGGFGLWFDHMETLKENISYTVCSTEYRGEVSEEGERTLFISQTDMERSGQTFNGAGVAKLLSNYEEGSFDLIGIHANSAVIRADVYNAAAPYLNQDYEQARIDYSFYKDAYGCSVIWTFDHPTAKLAQDADADASLEADGGNVAVSLGSTDVFKGCADSASMNFELEKDSALCAGVSGILGDTGKELSLFVPGDRNAVEDVQAGWNVDGDYSRLHIYNLQNLTANRTYSLGEYTYRGNTWIDEDGTRNLWISSFDFDGAEKLEKSQLEAIVKWYAGEAIEFDRIYIEEKYAEKGKIIRKDYVNLALQILDDGYDPSVNATDTWNRLTFVFANDQDGKEDKLFWHFWNPNTAKADISADVTLTAAENAGVTYKLSSKQADLKALAQSSGIEFRVSPGMERAESLIKGFGEIGENEDSWLLILKAGTDRESNVHPHYGNWDGVLDLDISCVQWCAANTNYVLLRPVEVKNSYNVGNVVTLGAGDFALTQVPDGAVLWKTADAGVAYVSSSAKNKSSELWIVDSGETYVWASYKAGKTACTEAFRIRTTNDITGITFDSDELTMSLNYVDGVKENGYEECRSFLGVKFTPATSGCSTDYYPDDAENRNEIRWESDAPEVVAFVKQTDGEGRTFINGEIQAVGPGTAVITATLLNGMEDTEAAIKAVCKVTVMPAISMEDMDWPAPYALAGIDKTLSDVELPAGWEWVVPETDLTKFAGANGHNFEARYTWNGENGLTGKQTFTLYVRMVSVSEIAIAKVTGKPDLDSEWDTEEVPAVWEMGSSLALWWGVSLNNIAEEDNYDDFLNDLTAVWTTSLGTISDPGYEGIREKRIRSYAAEKTGKEKISVTVYYGDPGNGGVKLGTQTVSLNIAGNEPFNFETDVISPSPVWDASYSYVDKKGKEIVEPSLFLYVNAEKYDELGKKKLAFTSGDTSVLKLGKQTVYTKEAAAQFTELENVVVIRVPYTVKGKGTAVVTATAYGDVTSSATYSYKVADPTPKLSETTLTVNRALTDASAQLAAVSDCDYPIVDISLGEGVNGFQLGYSLVNPFEKVVDEETLTVAAQADITISLKENSGAAKGTYKVPVFVKTTAGEATAFTLTVRVTETLPAFTVKQTKKVNLFYNDEEGDGELSVTAKNAEIEKLWLEDNVNYEVVPNEKGSWNIRLKEGVGDGLSAAEVNKLNKKGTLYCTLAGYEEEKIKVKALTISAAVTKPSIVQSAKSDTLYTVLDYRTSRLKLTDKATKEALDISSALYMVKKTGTEIIAENAGTFKPQYNTFAILYEGDGVLSFKVTETDLKTRTDKFSLQVKEENWRDYLTVSYSVKTDVATAAPRVKLGNAAITLNAADDVYAYQQVKTPITLSGSAGLLDDDTYVWFTGNDAKSIQALKMDGKLVLQYWGGDQSSVVARINESGLAAGTYKYTVWVANDSCGYKASAALTVKVMNKAAEKCLSVSAKGSIDVLDREGTSIVYTPKLSNLTGKAADSWLEGRDAYMFDAAFDQTDGRLYVRAREGVEYVTGYAYQVVPVFWIDTEDYAGFELSSSKALTIRVKQGKPKVTASSAGNTLYRSSANSIRIDISALLGTKQVAIENVELLNYSDDLYLEEYEAFYMDENGEIKSYMTTFEPESGYILLKAKAEPKEILKVGKTWSVKLSIRYMEQAGNEKNAQVTYKAVVR